MKVVLHVGRLVVHGATGFDRDAFITTLRAELASRVPARADPGEVARRFASRQATVPDSRQRDGATARDGAARHLATRLLP